jgi:hypothetical protein
LCARRFAFDLARYLKKIVFLEQCNAPSAIFFICAPPAVCRQFVASFGPPKQRMRHIRKGRAEARLLSSTQHLQPIGFASNLVLKLEPRIVAGLIHYLNIRPGIAGIAQRFARHWKHRRAALVGRELILSGIDRVHPDLPVINKFHAPCIEPFIAAPRGRFVVVAAGYRCGYERQYH